MHADQVWGLKEVERQAHEFAAAFLMPEADIADELPSRPDWPVLFELNESGRSHSQLYSCVPDDSKR